MATVGSVQGEKGAEESEESADTMWSSLTEIYRKNGFSTSYGCNEKSCKSIDSKLTKYNCIVKINGLKTLTKQTTLSGSIHLRPRPERSRPTKRPNTGCSLRDTHSHTSSGSINNNEEESSSASVSSMAGLVDETPLNSRIQRNKITRQHTAQTNHSGNNLSKLFQLKDFEAIDVKPKMTNGHWHRLQNGQVQNGHVSKLSMSPPVSSCRIKLVQSPPPVSPSSPQSSGAQLVKAAKISPSSPEDRLTVLRRKNGISPCRQPTPSLLSGLDSSIDNNVVNSNHSEAASCSSSISSASSQSCADDHRRNKSSWPSFLLINQEHSSSTSSLVSLSSRDGGTADGKSSKLTTCKWSKCSTELEPSELMDHLHNVHVRTQEGESFVCLWANCKVYNKTSSSRKWLERHVLSHSGDKPFKCIVDKCGMQFTSQYGLERHVNGHFNLSRPAGSKPGRHKEDTPYKNKKKKIKRKRTMPVKTDDFFDQRIMEGIQHQLFELSESTEMDLFTSGNQITFHSTVIARRRDTSGILQVLLRWNPENILSDSWVPESQVDKLSTQVRFMAELPRDKVANLHPNLYVPHRHRKHCRK